MYILELNCDIAYGISVVVFYAMFSAQFIYIRQGFDLLSYLYTQVSMNGLAMIYTYWYIVGTKGLTEE